MKSDERRYVLFFKKEYLHIFNIFFITDMYKIIKSLLFISIILIVNGCGEKTKSTDLKETKISAFDDYQSKRLDDFNKYFASGAFMRGLEDWQIVAFMMDWNLGQNRYATLSILRSGRTKIFTSTGAKDISIDHQNVTNEVGRFLEYAATVAPYAQPMNHTKLPEPEHFSFYFKTNEGTSKAEGYIGDVNNNSSEWSELFRRANNVITEVRATYQDFGNNPE